VSIAVKTIVRVAAKSPAQVRAQRLAHMVVRNRARARAIRGVRKAAKLAISNPWDRDTAGAVNKQAQVMENIYLLLSPDCNLQCTYCFQLENQAEVPHRRYHSQPGIKATKETIVRFAEFCAENKVQHVEFFGGEPMLYRDLFQFAVHTLFGITPQITIGVVTNGTMIDEAIMRLIERYQISILLSLDGDQQRHDLLRGGFERMLRWFPRLRRLKQIRVALQAGVIPGLAENVRFVWRQGFTSVFLNMIESYGWYRQDDVVLFQDEYEDLLQRMLRGEGLLLCATKIHEQLRETSHTQGCGITRLGLACDWHGRLYPCHRAVELGAQFAVGDLFSGLDVSLDKALRERIGRESFGSSSAMEYPLASYCPIAIYQKHQRFDGPWNGECCRMIEVKTRLVAKYFHELAELLGRPAQPIGALDCTKVVERPVEP